MDHLIVIALLVAAVLGMCVGTAIGHQLARPLLLRAQRAEGVLRELRAELEAYRHVGLVGADAERVPPPAPVTVHVHMPALHPSWPQPPVVDGRVVGDWVPRRHAVLEGPPDEAA